MPTTPEPAVLLGLIAIFAALITVLIFALWRFAIAARALNRKLRDDTAQSADVAAALHQALAKMRDQEQATKARAEASERLSSEIILSMTAGLLVVGVNGDIRTLNPAGRRLLGLPDGALPASFRDLEDSAAPLADLIEECLAGGRPITRRTLKLPRETSSGASHLGVSVSPILDNLAGLQGAICLFTDLSAVAGLEEQLRLRESFAKLGELAAGIAHEFRNGLATIHGYSRLMELDRLPEVYRPYVEGIRQETEALTEVVTKFLQFARPAKLTLTSVDLGAVAERAMEEIKDEARALGGDVGVRGEFGKIEGDEVLLRQAFANLCRNALEACADAAIVPRILLEGSVEPDRRMALVTVSDNGPGIDVAVQDFIFRPFFTTKAKGTGLGLSLVQKIIVTHNGRITASARPGGGAAIQVALPL